MNSDWGAVAKGSYFLCAKPEKEARLALDARLCHLKSADDIRIFRKKISGARVDRPEPGRKIVERGNVLVETRLESTAMVARADASEANPRRTETTLSRMQSDVEACRLPRVASLPLVPGLPLMDPVIDRSTLDPTLQRLPIWQHERQKQAQPPSPGKGNVVWPHATKFLIACGIAAPLYYFAVVTSPLDKHLAEVAELARHLSEPPAQHPLETRDGLFAISMASGPEATPEQQSTLAPELTVGPPASPTSPPATNAIADGNPRSSPDRALAPATKTANLQDAKLLFDRGKQFLEAGDLVAARILFLRVANAGDAAAAVAMGATYDPIVLADHRVRGVAADLDRARSWYERAKEMGSPEGLRRLELLAKR